MDSNNTSFSHELSGVRSPQKTSATGLLIAVFGAAFLSPMVAQADSVGLYLPPTSSFLLKNSAASGTADHRFSFGFPNGGFVAITGDWDGDRAHEVALFSLNRARVFQKYSHSGGGADALVAAGDGVTPLIPFAGDWNGSGVDTVALYEPGRGLFHLTNSPTGNASLVNLSRGIRFGPMTSTRLPLAGDWDGDGRDGFGLYDPSNGSFVLINGTSALLPPIRFPFGPVGPDSAPLVGDWNNDGSDEIGIYVSSTGRFFLSNTASPGAVTDNTFRFGQAGQQFGALAGTWVPPVGVFRAATATPDLISFEAEHFGTRINTAYSWQKNSRNGSSGEGVIVALPDDATNLSPAQLAQSPRANYRVNFPSAGRWYIWVRATGRGFGSNSIHIGLDRVGQAGSLDLALSATALVPSWSTGNYFLDVPAPGPQSVNIWMRESGTVLDKIVLTTDPNFRPQEFGPPESPRAPIPVP
jgi:hypothetical protein